MEIFKEWLQNNGYRFSVELFGITFKHQGGNFIIGNNTGDNSYLQILMPGVYTLNNPSEKQHGLEVCNELNKEIKCIKAFFFDDETIWLATEMFIDHTPELDDFMERLFGILHTGQLKLLAKI